MKRALLSRALLVFILFFQAATVALHAQSSTSSIAGTWQGALELSSSNSIRVAFSIAKNSDGSLHGGIRYVDHDAGLVFSSITFSAPDLVATQSTTSMAYHGKLSADGQYIIGTWLQGDRTLPLTLTLATPASLWKPAGPPPMASDADPSYEVAVIKPALPEEQHPVWNMHASEFHATGTNAAELIKMVYKIRGRQIMNAPPWVEERKFDITAKPDIPGVPNDDQTRIMIRKLLTERFHLVCHTGTQDFPALVMTLDPKGPSPVPSNPDYNVHGGMFIRQERDEMQLQLFGVTMHDFIKDLMDRYRDEQIVDETGLTGTYDITLHLPPTVFQGTGDGGVEDEVGTDYIAAAKHAGFKFVSKKAPLPVVIIDHIDPPTAN
ncbi:TIGR03435 family protein [Telmatobacter bradus]|uniref:TIGR03435 family protein n=1 Tax=Telmatobacter bradus TaxID=474953 RepID=UPI003B435E8C